MTAPRIQGRTREGIVTGGAPLDAMMASRTAETALQALEQGQGSTEAADNALATLEDAVRQLPGGQAARYDGLMLRLRTAIQSRRQGSAIASVDSARRRPRVPGRAAAARVYATRGPEAAAATLVRSRSSLARLSRQTPEALQRDLQRAGLSENAAATVVDHVERQLGQEFHGRVRSAARDYLREEVRHLERASRGVGEPFEIAMDNLWGTGGRELLMRLSVVAPDDAAALTRLLDRAETRPSERDAMRTASEPILQRGLAALHDHVEAYAAEVASGDEGVNGFFGEAYRAFPRIARREARRLGVTLGSRTPQKRASVAARAIHRHLQETEQRSNEAREDFLTVIKYAIKWARVPLPSSTVAIMDDVVRFDRNRDRSVAGVRDPMRIVEDEAQLVTDTAARVGSDAAETLLLDPATDGLAEEVAPGIASTAGRIPGVLNHEAAAIGRAGGHAVEVGMGEYLDARAEAVSEAVVDEVE
ncbi:MAG: hypothetical protein AAGE52_22185 [Myxococcota bacterium]